MLTVRYPAAWGGLDSRSPASPPGTKSAQERSANSLSNVLRGDGRHHRLETENYRHVFCLMRVRG
jgi:hypothetical protein